MQIQRTISVEEVRHGQVRVWHGDEWLTLVYGPADDGSYIALDSEGVGVLVLTDRSALDISASGVAYASRNIS